VEQVVFLCKPS